MQPEASANLKKDYVFEVILSHFIIDSAGMRRMIDNPTVISKSFLSASVECGSRQSQKRLCFRSHFEPSGTTLAGQSRKVGKKDNDF